MLMVVEYKKKLPIVVVFKFLVGFCMCGCSCTMMWQIVVVCQVGSIHYRNRDPCKSILQGLGVTFLECAVQSRASHSYGSEVDTHFHALKQIKVEDKLQACILVLFYTLCHKRKMDHKGHAFTWLPLAHGRVM